MRRAEPMLTSASSPMETVNEAAPDAGHRARVTDAKSGPTRNRTSRTPGRNHDSVHLLPPSLFGRGV